MNAVGFPGLGLGPFTLDPTALVLGPIHVRWYGVIIVCGMLLSALYAFMRMKSIGLSMDDCLDVALVCIPCGIVGARLYYVLTSLSDYSSFWEVFKVWEGGLAIYGGIIGGLLGVVLIARHKKKNVLALLDCIAPGVMLGQSLGRWGNFVNAEAYGVIGQYDFLGLSLDASALADGNPLLMTINGLPVHPTFLYESVWSLVGFLLINAFWKKHKYDGQVLLEYLTWYGFGRAFLEGLRGDSLYVGSIRISQLLAFLCFLVGSVLLAVFAVKNKNKKQKGGL